MSVVVARRWDAGTHCTGDEVDRSLFRMRGKQGSGVRSGKRGGMPILYRTKANRKPNPAGSSLGQPQSHNFFMEVKRA
jgi:hypothetical protein